MKNFKFLLNLLMALSAITLMAVPVSPAVADFVSTNHWAIVPGVVGLAYQAANYTIHQMVSPHVFGAVEVEIWSKHIQDNLFKGVEWLTNCFRADEHVLSGKVVHIPQAGAAPAAQKNRSVFPGTVYRRSDADVTYALDEFTTDPIAIADADTKQLSYDKRASALTEHMGVLQEMVADNIIINWAPSLATSQLRTSSATNYPAHLPAATGTRKGLTLNDMKKASSLLTKQKISKMDRYALMSQDMFDQLEDEVRLTSTRDYSRIEDPTTGIIAKLYTFNIVVVPNATPIYNNAGTPVVKAYGAAGAITDNDSVICYQKNALELAMGDVKFFANEGDPTHYGDIYSALVNAGGRIRRNDQKGVVAIIQIP